jgi:hypothetical protein
VNCGEEELRFVMSSSSPLLAKSIRLEEGHGAKITTTTKTRSDTSLELTNLLLLLLLLFNKQFFN